MRPRLRGKVASTTAAGSGMGCAAVLAFANAVKRKPCSAAHITIGLQCGGSDGYSGISANPALGVAVDLLVAHGGTAILSETSEVYGAEHLLTRRAVKREVGQKLVDRIKWWKHYTTTNEGGRNNNPSHGNKAGGLTTILEKSLDAVAKGGTSNLKAVYEYAEPVAVHSPVFMDTPGYDPVSATGQVAGGANLIICFTTGRGSAYGCASSLSLKLATNSALWQRQQEDMDINCGEIVDGTKEFICPKASRSGLDRSLRRHGLSNLHKLKPIQPKSPHKPFKSYVPGLSPRGHQIPATDGR